MDIVRAQNKEDMKDMYPLEHATRLCRLVPFGFSTVAPAGSSYQLSSEPSTSFARISHIASEYGPPAVRFPGIFPYFFLLQSYRDFSVCLERNKVQISVRE